MPAIEVTNLQKTFQTKRKAAGMSGSMRALFKPEYSSVEAVRGLTFQMEAGELLGFIGPNGAGKSTTIKMLTGILHPTSGEAQGAWATSPGRNDRSWPITSARSSVSARSFGTTCPPSTRSRSSAKSIEMDDRDTQKRIGQIAEAFEIQDLLETPVRKLSLGQRMRCEVAASLLHRPKLILLDEPSIGLDVVAKQHIRDAIREMARLENVGVLLTSHDAGDLEALCRRVIIINHGQIVYEDKVSNLKRKFLTSKLVEVRYAEEVPPNFHIDGAEMIKVGHYGVKLRFDIHKTSVEKVLSHLTDAGSVVDITISDPPLEEVIAKIYQTQDTVLQ